MEALAQTVEVDPCVFNGRGIGRLPPLVALRRQTGAADPGDGVVATDRIKPAVDLLGSQRWSAAARRERMELEVRQGWVAGNGRVDLGEEVAADKEVGRCWLDGPARSRFGSPWVEVMMGLRSTQSASHQSRG